MGVSTYDTVRWKKQKREIMAYRTGDILEIYKIVFGENREFEDSKNSSRALSRALEFLNGREGAVLMLHKVGQKTLREIGEIMGISMTRVRQIESKALRKMRHPLCVKILKENSNKVMQPTGTAPAAD